MPLFTHVFIHGGVFHILMNLLAYFQAAPFLARRMGGARFLVLFFLAAIGGAIGYILIDMHSQQPAVGASGAICGVFGAYFLAVRPTPQAALADPQVRNAMLSFLGINVVLMASPQSADRVAGPSGRLHRRRDFLPFAEAARAIGARTLGLEPVQLHAGAVDDEPFQPRNAIASHRDDRQDAL